MTKLTGKLSIVKQLDGKIDKITDYNHLNNKPKIENVTLEGNKTFEELGLIECSNQDIENMFKGEI